MSAHFENLEIKKGLILKKKTLHLFIGLSLIATHYFHCKYALHCLKTRYQATVTCGNGKQSNITSRLR